MGKGMEDFKTGFRKATGAEASDEEKKKKAAEESDASIAAQMLSDTGSDIYNGVSDLLKKKKQ